MKKYSRKYIGQKFITNEDYTAEVIDGGSKAGDCTCKIEDHIFECQVDNLKKGVYKYPFHPSVHGKGYIGVGEYKTSINGKHTKVYQVWRSMLRRVYDEKYLIKYPTYRNATICKEWHNFQVFAKWVSEESNFREGWQLDKDLMSKDTKGYSPETCTFISQKLNSFLANNRLTNTSGTTGVIWLKRDKKWWCRICIDGENKNLGYFKDKQEAANVYMEARAIEVEKLKELYKDTLPKEILEKIR